ncbi:MAG: hypothetical protein KDD55_10825 [Bdellovibrionales bacterium]|nr:hypothetical protein [Bdellovibrionales bacterium]
MSSPNEPNPAVTEVNGAVYGVWKRFAPLWRTLRSRAFFLPFFAVVALTGGAFLVLGQLEIHPLFRPNSVHWVATVILSLYLWSLWVLPKRELHVAFALTGMTLDIGLTIYHEVGLRAFRTALGIVKDPYAGDLNLRGIHIWVSIALLVSYLAIWITGRALLPKEQRIVPLATPVASRGSRSLWRRVHRMCGVTTLLLNAASWFTSPYFLAEYFLAR